MASEGFIALLTAVVILSTAVFGFMSAKLREDSLRAREDALEAKRDAADIREKTEEIHVMVNSQAERQTSRIEQLIEALREAGIEIPDRPELEAG